MLKHVLTPAALALSTVTCGQATQGIHVTVTSRGKADRNYLGTPAGAARKPAVILLHSFRGWNRDTATR
ncbi:MAG: hypothetical protein AB1511_14785 [Deinococcota bacterium]